MKFKYDYNADMLYVKKEDEKIDKTLDLGDFKLHFGTEERLIGFELFNASKIVMAPEEVDTSEFLRELESVDMSVDETANGVLMKCVLESDLTEENAIISNTSPSASTA